MKELRETRTSVSQLLQTTHSVFRRYLSFSSASANDFYVSRRLEAEILANDIVNNNLTPGK
jgi:hypothetical protein